MKEDIASEYYLGAEGYNCAQAILSAFKDDAALGDDEIKAAKTLGGGRAENGVCGAVYAMKRVLGDDLSYGLATSEFKKNAGSIYCRNLRQDGPACKECVRLAAELCERINSKDK